MDYDVPSVEFWLLVFDVLKPGGHVLSFGGTRTYHRMVVNLEDAGFEIRDQIVWLYGSGFPKSMDVSKAIDKAAGVERIDTGGVRRGGGRQARLGGDFVGSACVEGLKWKAVTIPATPEATEWEGWGTALKPAMEPVVLGRKPLEEPTVASNVLKYRTGGINVDGCRVETTDNLNGGTYSAKGKSGPMPGDDRTGKALGMFAPGVRPVYEYVQPTGRFPANVILDEDTGELLDAQTGDSGGASRFFYSAKASKKERRESKHPTVKPLALMRYLCRLITPPGGTVLDPFAGSGTTGEAAVLEGFHPVMIELEPEYVKDIENRMKAIAGGTEPDQMPPAPRNVATLESLFVD